MPSPITRGTLENPFLYGEWVTPDSHDDSYDRCTRHVNPNSLLPTAGEWFTKIGDYRYEYVWTGCFDRLPRGCRALEVYRRTR